MSGNQNGENVQQKKEKMCSVRFFFCVKLNVLFWKIHIFQIGETIYTWTQNKHATTYVGTYTKAFFSGEVCREIREHDEFLGMSFSSFF